MDECPRRSASRTTPDSARTAAYAPRVVRRRQQAALPRGVPTRSRNSRRFASKKYRQVERRRAPAALGQSRRGASAATARPRGTCPESSASRASRQHTAEQAGPRATTSRRSTTRGRKRSSAAGREAAEAKGQRVRGISNAATHAWTARGGNEPATLCESEPSRGEAAKSSVQPSMRGGEAGL